MATSTCPICGGTVREAWLQTAANSMQRVWACEKCRAATPIPNTATTPRATESDSLGLAFAKAILGIIIALVLVLIAVIALALNDNNSNNSMAAANQENQPTQPNRPTQKYTVVLSTWDISGTLVREKIVAVTDNFDDAKSAADSVVSSLNPTFYTSDVYRGTGAITMSQPFDTDAFGQHLHANGGIMRYDGPGVPIYGTNAKLQSR